jgi:hypothetical protein
MNTGWESLRWAAKATDRETAFRENWPVVAAQLRQWGYSSWGIAGAHGVLSSGGSLNEAAEALRSEEEMTAAGRARVRRLRRIAARRGFALRRSARTPFPRNIPACRWTIVNPQSNSIVAPADSIGRRAMNLDDVEAWLTRDET